MKKLLLLIGLTFTLTFSQKLYSQCTGAQSSIDLTIDFTGDSYPEEDAWKIINTSTGATVDSVCFGVYSSGGTANITLCLDTGITYILQALDDYGDGLDGSSWSIDYTFGGNIGTLGSNNYNVAINNPYCGASYSNNEVADSISFYVTYVAAPSCLPPNSLTSSNVSSSSADLSWTENNGATSWNLEYGPSGFTPGSGTTVNINSNPYTLTGLNAAASYDWYINSDCGGSTSPNAFGGSFTTLFSSPRTITCNTGNLTSTFTEEFDNTNFWTGDIGSGTTARMWNIISGSTGSGSTGPTGAHSGSTYLYYEASSGTPTQATIVSNAIDLTGAIQVADLSFWMHAYGSSMGTFTLGVGTSSSGPFTTLFTWNQEHQTASSDPWENIGVDLDAYIGQTIYLQMDMLQGSNYYGDMSFDLFEIKTCANCVAPTALNSSNLSTSSADLSWTENGSATQWQIEFGTAGFSLGNGTSILTSSLTHSISGLSANTSYDSYVRSICGPADTSAWSALHNFNTPCAAVNSFPYIENFDGGLTNSVWNCWNVINDDSDGYTWSQASTYITPRSGSNTAHGMGSNNDHLISPQIALPGAMNMRLKIYDIVESSTYRNDYYVLVSTTGTAVSDFTDTLAFYSVTNTSWTERIIDLSAYSGMNIYIDLWQNYSGSTYYGFGLDDFTIEEIPACVAPTALTLDSLSSTTASISWTDNAGASNWDIEYDTTGFTQGTGNSTTASSSAHTISGLTANSSYDIYVRADCGSSQSSWVGPITVYTGYCIPSPSSVDNSGITNVSFSTVNNTTSTETNNYGDYSAMVGDISQTTTVAVDITYETGYTYVTEIWIDWNNDLDFEDAGENVYSGTSTSANPTTLNASFVVPLNAPLGHHRMRIGGADTGPPTPCYTGSYGSYEDYTVNVIAPPSCPAPNSVLTSNISSNSFDLNWTEVGSATTWMIEYDTAGFALGTGNNSVISSNPTVISSLLANTSYDIYLRSICAIGDSSTWVGPINVTTLCNPFTATYTNNFDSEVLDLLPSCWSMYDTYQTTAWIEVEDLTGSNAPYSGAQALYMYSSYGFSAGSDTLAAISPAFSDMKVGDKRFRFQAKSSSTSNQLIVGTVSSPLVPSSFVPLDTFSFASTYTFNEYVVEVTADNGYNGNDEYLVLAHGLGSTYSYIVIDDFVYEDIPSCNNVSNFATDSIMNTSIDLTWTAGGSEVDWDIEYGPTGFTPGAGTIAKASSSPYRLSGLTPSTTYDFYISGNCAKSTSPIVGPITATTYFNAPQGYSCSSGTNAPLFTEEFDNSNFWTGDLGTGSTARKWNIKSGGTTSGSTGPSAAHSGTYYIYYEASSGTPTQATIVSNGIDLSAASEYAELSFWIHAYGNTMGTFNLGVSSSALGPFTNVFSWSDELQTSNGQAWENVGVDLSAYIGQTIYLQMDMQQGSDFYGDMSFDLFEINTCLSCLPPSSPSISNISTTSVDLAWTANTATSWEIEYGPSGFTQGAGATVTANSNPYTLSGLTSATDYDWYLRELCGPGDESNWIIGGTFTTLCDTYPLPYTEGFENAGAIPNCWEQSLSNSEDWKFGSGTAATYGPTSGMGGSGYYAWLDDSSPHNTASSLETPNINLGAAANPGLEFQMWSESHASTESQFLLHIEVDAGSGFTNLRTLDVENNGWELQRISLYDYIGQTIKIRFTGEEVGTGYQKDIAIDNISIDDNFECEDPTNLVEVYKSDTSAVLLWDVNPTPGIYYWVQWKEYGTANWNNKFMSNNIGRHDISGLKPNTSYLWQVRSNCMAGWSNPVWKHFKTLSAPCLVPTNIRTHWKFSDQVQVRWDTMPNSIHYRLRYREQGTTTWQPVIQTAETSYWIAGLTANTTYEYQVKSTCEWGFTSGTVWSSTYSFTTTGTAAPLAPSRIKFQSNENELEQQVNIYPNPNNGEFNLSFKLELDKSYKLEIRDVTGRLIQQEDLRGTGQTISKPMRIDDAAGVYFMRIFSDQETMIKRIIIE